MPAAFALLCLILPFSLEAQTDSSAPARGRLQETFSVKPSLDRQIPPQPRPVPPSRLDPTLRAWAVPRRMIEAPDVERLKSEDRARQIQQLHRKVRAGVVLEHAPIRTDAGVWAVMADGRNAWMLEIGSPGAKAIRLRLRDLALAEGARLFILAAEGDGPAEVTATSKKDYFSVPVPGDAVRLEALLPAGARREEFSITIEGVGYLYRDPASEKLGGDYDAGACNLDAKCYPVWQESGDSTVHIMFEDAQYIYSCSSAMVNNLTADLSPYLLTANHCIDSQALASSVTAFFGHETTTCNTPPSISYSSGGGATYLNGSADADITLLQFNGWILPGTVFAGWTLDTSATPQAITGIHYPEGSYRRISFGKRQIDNFSFPNFHRVIWDSGVTEPGSSGSPLFNASHQVMGTLWGGSSSCQTPKAADYYGKLSLAYSSLTGPNGNYLETGLPDDSLPANHSKVEAYTLVLPSETKNLIVKASAEDWFKITVPADKYFIAVVKDDSNLDHAFGELYDEAGNLLRQTVGRQDLPTLVSGSSKNLYVRVVPSEGFTRVPYSIKVYYLDPVLPVVSSFGATAVSYRTISLQGTTSLGYFPVATAFEYSTDSSFATFQSVAGISLSPPCCDSGFRYAYVDPLIPGTNYWARFAATNVAGTTRSTAAAVTLPVFPVPTLNFPADGVTRVQFSPLTLAWDQVAGTSFDVYFGTAANPPFLQSTTAKFLQFQTLPATKYYWRLVARDLGESASSVIKGFTTIGPLTVSSGWLDFPSGLVNSKSTGQNVTVTNQGPAASAVLVTVPPSFSSGSNCPSQLAPAASCIVTTYFQPVSTGFISGYVKISSAPGFEEQVYVTGTAYDIQLALSRPGRPSRGGSGGGSAAQRSAMVTVAGQGAPGSSASVTCAAPAGVTCSLSMGEVPLDGGAHAIEVSAVSTGQRRAARLGAFNRAERTVTVRVTASFGGGSRSVDVPLVVGQ
ncbi:MAG: trypsin-like peptidase domain-containing protein [Acidobacteriales bacterium]|nr:trypsin-like peptidase domain-containing protein [Terriglobales bacterium]